MESIILTGMHQLHPSYPLEVLHTHLFWAKEGFHISQMWVNLFSHPVVLYCLVLFWLIIVCFNDPVYSTLIILNTQLLALAYLHDFACPQERFLLKQIEKVGESFVVQQDSLSCIRQDFPMESFFSVPWGAPHMFKCSHENPQKVQHGRLQACLHTSSW